MRKAKRWLAAWMALAMFITMLPAMPTAAEAEVSDHVIPLGDRYEQYPEGITLDLFDYSLDPTESDPDAGTQDEGIDAGHVLKFGEGMGNRKDDPKNINYWTESAAPFTGIVSNTLENGYPTLQYTGANQHGTGESLSYLFNGRASTGKQAHMNVGGLLQQDEEGYFYYNSQQNFAEYDEATNAFKLYDTWSVYAGGQSPNGQFFPFNTGAQVFDESANGDLVQKADSNNQSGHVDSLNNFINHYFGIHMDTRFQQPEGGMSPTTTEDMPITYSFSGDDDVWIYIDDVLVADLGGIHNATSVYIDFSDGDITVFEDSATGANSNGQPDYGETVYSTTTLKQAFEAANAEDKTTWNDSTFADETYHTMDFFYLERGNTDSNMRLKFNLVTTPESTLEKVDQDGAPVAGATYALYETGEDYVVAQNAAPLATGTTDKDGTFVFEDNDGKTLALSMLTGSHYVLREVQTPEGYRSAGDIHLYLEQSKTGEKSKLLLSNNEWDTGAYAAAKVRVIADTQSGSDGARYVTDLAGHQHDITAKNAKVFAAVFHDDQGVTYGETVADYEAVYGDPIHGWHTTQAKGIEALIEVAADMDPDGATREYAVEGLYQFDYDSANRFVVDIENLPDDIHKYAWMGEENPTYTGAYFYTTAATYDQMDASNTFQLDAEEFLRDFAVTLYAPNINNRLLVQKTNEDGTQALADAEFALYKQENLTVAGDGSWTKKDDADQPVQTVTTQTQYQLTENQIVPGANAMMGIPLGEYYLVETAAPADYKINPQAIAVVVDNSGVHVDAGTADDDITVTLGVGKVVKSMVQFAVDDGIDASLHDITATLQTSDSYPADDVWQDGGSMVLSYDAEDLILEYGPATPEGATVLSYESGWGRLNITQTDHDTTANGSSKQDLTNQSLNNLFSGTTLVTVGDKLQAPGNVTITKHVESTVESDKNDAYQVRLTVVDGNFHGGKITVSGSDQPLTFDENHEAILEIKDGETIHLDVPANVQLEVEEIDPGNAFDVTYAVDGQKIDSASVTAGENDTHQVVITNTRTSGESVMTSTDQRFSITKEVTGGDWPDGEDFTFTIAAATGTPMPENADGSEQDSITISRPADGSNAAAASFGDITFTQTGEYVYTITENKGDADNMTYDDHTLTVTVTVGKNDDGALQIESVSYDSSVDADDEAAARTFTNIIGKEEPDNPGGGGWIPGGGGDDDMPDLNTEDHFSYIVGYPEDYRTGEATDDESLWPVKPQGNITRAEVATIFYRLLTDEARTENWTRDNDYTDVAADSWYNTPVSTLGAMGIVRGYEDGSFRPDAPITRAEFAAIAVRFFENDNVNYEEGLFTDIAGSEWFADAVAAAQEHGIVGGYPDGSFQPNKAITRAEATSIVNRTVDRIPDKDHLLPDDQMRVWPDNSDPDIWYYADMQEATSGHEYDWVLDDNDEPLCEQWTGDLPEVDWEQVEIDQEEKHGLR